MPQSTWRVRLLGIATGCVMLVAALELASFALYFAATGHRFSYARIAREQAGEIEQAGPRLIGETAPGTDAVAPPGQAEEGRPEATPVQPVPHPFTGFVYDPETLSHGSHPGAMALTDLGFFRLAAPQGGGEERSVAIFGGSVAVYFSLDGREALMRALAEDPALRGRRVRVECFALGGFKQPQMLTALAYLLALGHRFDVVIELDGVNDVVVSFLDYKARGLFHPYPQDWDHLVGQMPDIQEQRLIGKVVYLQGRRGWLAQRFSRRPLSWSITAALVWKSLDRWLSADLAGARQDLAGASGPGRAYREHGPVRRYASDQELMAEIVRLWGLSSLQMHRLCAAAGTRYYHFLQPSQYVSGSKPMGAGERAVAYRADHPYRHPIELGYPLLQAEGARLSALGVAFHDLSPVFAGITEPLYIDDCCHVNARGSAILGEAIGRIIVPGSLRGRLSESGPSIPAPPPPVTVRPLPDTAFQVEWLAHTVPDVMTRGTVTTVSVAFRNRSAVPWPDAKSSGHGGAGAVRLAYRWWAGSSQAPGAWSASRADLREPLQPGHAGTVELVVMAPPLPVQYRLQLELLQELAVWFQDKGAPGLMIPVRIR